MVAGTFEVKSSESAGQRASPRVGHTDGHVPTCHSNGQSKVAVVRDDDRSVDVLVEDIDEEVGGEIDVSCPEVEVEAVHVDADAHARDAMGGLATADAPITTILRRVPPLSRRV